MTHYKHKITEHLGRTTQKGSILVFSLLTLTIVMIAALSIASVTVTNRKSANVTGSSTAAFQRADGGLEDFLQQLYNGKNIEETSTLNELATEIKTLPDITDAACEEARSTEPYQPKITVTQSVGGREELYIVTPIEPEELQSDGDQLRCSSTLSEVGFVKVTGTHKNAARAIQVELTDPLDRGLTSYWSMEDYVDTVRLYPGTSSNWGGPNAKDVSRNDHQAFLCPNDDGISGPSSGCHESGNTDAMSHVDSWVDGVIESDDITDPLLSGLVGPLRKGAIKFDGGNHWLRVEDSDKLDFTDSVSISAWIKPDDVSDPTKGQPILSKLDWGSDPTTGGSGGYRLRVYGDKAVFTVQGNSGIKQTLSETELKADRWSHVVGVWQKGYESDEVIIYVDGDREDGGDGGSFGQELNSDMKTNDLDLMIARDFDTGTRFFGGVIDDVRLYDRALSEAEVERLCKRADETLPNMPSCANG